MPATRPARSRRARSGRVVWGLLGSRADVVLVDNVDSFVGNLADALAQLGAVVAVVRNDAVPARAVLASRPRGIVLSPGPLAPPQAGICLELLAAAPADLPILGVCLGHQAIGVAFGGRVVRARTPVHGRAVPVRHRGAGLLRGLPSPFVAARYHSLVVERRSLPACLEETAVSADGAIMGLRHRDRPVEGVQFHPESYLTPVGPRLLAAFLRRCGLRPRPARSVVR